MIPIVEAILLQMEASNLLTDNKEYTEEQGIALMQKDVTNSSATDKQHITDNSDTGNGSTLKIENQNGSMQNVTNTNGDVTLYIDSKQIGYSDIEYKGKSAKSSYFNSVAKALTLSITYAGKCGGMATLTGTPCNMIMKSQVDEWV